MSILSISPDELDADPWLLNAQNGTIDLRTGDLRPHQREDLLTKIVPGPYDPDAEAPAWDRVPTAGDAQRHVPYARGHQGKRRRGLGEMAPYDEVLEAVSREVAL